MIPRFLILLFLTSLPAVAEDFRQWKEVAGDREITAKILDKKLDSSSVQLSIKDGKTIWLECSKLSKADQDYVQKWARPFKHITARVIASGKGWKEVQVTAKAGPKKLIVNAYHTHPNDGHFTKAVEAGTELTFSYKALNDYSVTGAEDGKIIDKESSDRKTGL
ncbi:hypothetical protein [Luteolibacter sp. LG18]|uniref:hypothetical protein n=1 Tax=Luteolibacter sp. LG18 TaxID=2819286 RepID=UPI002B2B241C|nr:hypothetical protein llg_35000 [Luteolibacter sp. LG18]